MFDVLSTKIRRVCEGPEAGGDAGVSREVRGMPLLRIAACRRSEGIPSASSAT